MGVGGGDDSCGGTRAAPLGSRSESGMTESCGGRMLVVEDDGCPGQPRPSPGYRPTMARRCSPEDGTCTLMWRVEGVAAPVPWVPAYAGTTVFAGTTVGVF